jgi:hypothetical protein
LLPFIPLVPLGIVTEVPSVQVTTAPPSIAETEQELPLVPGCPAAPLLPEQPAARSAASAAKETDACTRLTFDMKHLVFPRSVAGTKLLFRIISLVLRVAMIVVMAASAC